MLDRILIVDDEPLVLETLSEVLSSEGYPVSQALAAREGLEVLARKPHALVLSDIRMPGMDGVEFLREVRRLHPGTDVVLMTGYGSLDGAIDAMALGAADYLIKPLNSKEVVARVRSILTRQQLESEVHSLHSALRSRYDMHQLVAESPSMSALVAAVHRIKDDQEPLLVYGESGSGRRFLARTIHYASERRSHEFALVDALVTTPLELSATLFGKRNPSGRRRRGLLERIGQGTVHLASLEALPTDLQQRLGAALSTRKLDVGEKVVDLKSRVILSSDEPPIELFKSGRLASELALLRQCPVLHMPPLLLRTQDLAGLVAVFVETYSSEHGRSVRVGPGVIELLASHQFPGNVTQLFAALSNAAKYSINGEFSVESIRRALRQSSLAEDRGIADHLGDREYQVILRAVRRNPGRLDQAAKELGISRTTLWRRMRKHEIKLEGEDA
ncbi:MAG: sigma-54-dependent Fis family transcriptional regulator [Planctomycetes bacterium]|nr:sigma-54-dependent Fis family transcriptional regulator [Planctomycetota bacterium]